MARGPNLFAGVLGALASGLLTVTFVELLLRSGRVKQDTAIDLVFPALFARGTFLVSRFFADVHLDTDAILYGEIAFAFVDRLIVNGLIDMRGEQLHLTDQGRQLAQQAMAR